MFALSPADLTVRILGCADGPASFNAEATRRGGTVISCDPLYRWNAGEIAARIDATAGEILDQTRLNAGEFVWTSISSIEELGRVRMSAMREFLHDYASGRAEGRYVAAAVPSLPFPDSTFDLALCSHLLFLYSSQLGEAFHLEAIEELCRVAGEVRIFPLVALGGEPSPYLTSCTRHLRDLGRDVTIERVPYEFQRGANQMMRVFRR